VHQLSKNNSVNTIVNIRDMARRYGHYQFFWPFFTWNALEDRSKYHQQQRTKHRFTVQQTFDDQWL